MSLDIRLVRVISKRSDFRKVAGSIPIEVLEPETRTIIDDISAYYEKFPDHERIDAQAFKTWAMKFRHANFKPETRVIYNKIIDQMALPPETVDIEVILNELHELKLVTGFANMCSQWHDGNLQHDFALAAQHLISQYKTDVGTQSTSWIQDDIEDILDETANNAGITWRLQSLNACTRGLHPGDFGIIAARPDRGKTTFFADQITHMASQLPDDKNIIWLNNEGPGKRIIPRFYQAALGCTLSELAAKREAGTLRKEYAAIVGRPDRIRVYDIHSMNINHVEKIIENSNPGIVVIDMIDNVKGFKSDARTDQVLESMYQWFREIATTHMLIALASSQVSAEGEGLCYPYMSMLKDSKTGKQGACDFLLMIGAKNDPQCEGSRFLSLPKNKIRREGAASNPNIEVLFQPSISRYADIGEESEILMPE